MKTEAWKDFQAIHKKIATEPRRSAQDLGEGIKSNRKGRKGRKEFNHFFASFASLRFKFPQTLIRFCTVRLGMIARIYFWSARADDDSKQVVTPTDLIL
jgi:hypothetical protein